MDKIMVGARMALPEGSMAPRQAKNATNTYIITYIF